MMVPQKRGYSGKVKALGIGIIVLEVATVIVFILALYSMGVTGVSFAQDVQAQVQTTKFNLQNVTTTSGQIQQAFVLPRITNKGYLPVTLSLNAQFLDAQSRNLGNALSESVTVPAGQSQSLVIPLSGGATAVNANGIQLSFEISSISGLLGMEVKATVTK